MIARGTIILGLLLVAGNVGAKDKAPSKLSTKQSEDMMANVKGTFDMTKQPRPYIAFLILDQAGNRYPSFWCGRNLEGAIKFAGQHDPLEDKIVVGQTGAFSVQLTNTARKYGMFDELPGGEWAEKLREVNFRVTFDKFANPVFKGIRKDGGDRAIGGNLIQFEFQMTGKASVGDRSAPITGTAVLEFSDFTPIFKLVAKFAFPGKELGLETGEGITATLYTASASTASSRPTLDLKPGADMNE